jgi:hypothetical protein
MATASISTATIPSMSAMMDDHKISINGTGEDGNYTNGIVDVSHQEEINGTSSSTDKMRRKKIVIVGLGMVAIAFMCVSRNPLA